MSGNFSFTNLNLSGVDVQEGRSLLPAGRYVAEVKSAKIVPTKKRDGHILEVQLAEVNGAGGITARINVNNPSAETTRIGRSELKSLLYYGGHPNPDQPGDVSGIKDLKVGIIVKPSSYMKDGQERVSSEVSGFCDPADIDPAKFTPKPAPVKKTTGAGGGFGDDIPF